MMEHLGDAVAEVDGFRAAALRIAASRFRGSARCLALLGCALGCSARSPLPASPQATGTGAAANVPSRAAFSWPGGQRAAVSLTYDDATPSQLVEAGPALARHGLRATFYVTGAARERATAWTELAAKGGHELGAHTLLHPCERAFDWVPKGNALEDYDPARMQTELDGNLALLRDLGVNAPYTFAYPCGSTWLGPARESYIPLVQKLFSAARGVSSQPIDPATVSLYETPAVAADQHALELTDLVLHNQQQGGWLVLLFHGVGGDHLPVDVASHERLLAYLAQHRNEIWTDTFKSVAAHVALQRGTAPPSK